MPSCQTGWGSVEEAHWEVQASSTSGEDPAILGVVQQIWDHMDPTHCDLWQDRGSFIHGAIVLLGIAIGITMITMIFPGSWSHNSEQEQRALPGKRHLVCHYEGGKNIGLKPGIVCFYRFIGTSLSCDKWFAWNQNDIESQGTQYAWNSFNYSNWKKRRRWGNVLRFNGFYGALASIHRNVIDGDKIWAFWEHPLLFLSSDDHPGKWGFPYWVHWKWDLEARYLLLMEEKWRG